MNNFMQNFLVVRAARELKEEIEKAGLENLKTLAEAGISIIKTYLEGCSPEEREKYKQDGNTLLQMGVTSDMVIKELVKQMPELASIMEGKEGYKQSEIKELEAFLKD